MAENRNVEERIVEMQIDHKNFEDGAKKTIKTLEKLEKALKFQSESSALDNLSNSFNRFDASPMADSIEKVSLKLSAMEIIGMRVIQNLTDSVYNFATKTVKDLTIDQVGAGWNKYEQLTEAVQTIMAATRGEIGTTWATEEEQMAAINEYLAQLLWYSDETSYSFTDMVSNLGKFLSAGVPLEDAVTAMMGISSWGASAGAKATEVARAMYNISQAMGQGSMKMMDWRSIENANMATLEFKKNVLAIAHQKGLLSEVMYLDDETTRAYSKIIDPARLAEGEDGLRYIQNMTEAEVDALITAANFRESLSSGWFTSDLMTEVFAQYGQFAQMLYTAVDQTGIQATDMLELLDKYRAIGTETEDKKFDWAKYAREAGMEVEDFMALLKSLDAYGLEFSENGFRMGQEAKTWTDALLATKDAVSSGWMRTFQYIFGDFLEAKEFWTAVTGELYDIFAEGGNVRNDILAAWKNFGGRDALLGLPRTLEDGKTVIQGALWNIVDAIRALFDPIHNAFAEVFGFATGDQIKKTGASLAEFTERIREFTSKLILSEKAQETLKVIFKGIFTVVKGGLTIIGKVTSLIFSVINVLLSLPKVAKDAVSRFTSIFTRLWNIIRHGFERGGIDGIINALKRELPRIFPVIRDTLMKLFEAIPSLFPELISKLGGLKNIFSIIFSLLLTGLKNLIPMIFGLVYYIAVGAVDIIKTVFNTIKTKVLPGLIDSFKNTFLRLWNVIRHGFERGGIMGVFDALKREFSRTFSKLPPVFKKLKKAFDPFVDSFKKNFPKVYDNLSKLNLKERIGDFSKNLDNVRKKISSFFGSIRSYMSNKATSIAGWFRAIDWADLRAQSPILDKILTFFSSVSEYLKGKWDSFQNWFDFSKLSESIPILDSFHTAWNTISTFASTKWEAVKEWFNGIDLSNFDLSKLSGYIPTLESFGAAWNTISTFVSTKWEAVKEWFNGIDLSKFNLGELSKYIPTLEDFGAAWNTISAFVTEKWEAVKEWFNGIDLSKFDLSKLSEYVPTLEDFGTAWNTISTFVSTKWEAVKEWFNGIDLSKFNLGELSKYIPTLEDFGAAWNAISAFVTEKWDKVKEWLDKLDFSKLTEWFDGIDWGPISEHLPTMEDISSVFLDILTFLKDIIPLLKQGALTLLIVSLRGFFNELSDIIGSFGGGKDESFISKISNSILELAGSIVLITLALKIIESIPAPMLENVLGSLDYIMSELLMFAAGIRLLGGAPRMGAFLSLAVALVIFVGVIKSLSIIDSNAFALGMFRILEVLGTIYLVSTRMAGLKFNGLKNISKLIGSVALLGVVVVGLSILNTDAFAIGLIRVMTIMGAVVLFTRFMQGYTLVGLANISRLTAAIAVLAVMVAVLSLLDTDTFAVGIIRLGTIMGLIILLMRYLQGSNLTAAVAGGGIGLDGLKNAIDRLKDSLAAGGGLIAALQSTLWWLVAIAAITGIVIAGIHNMNEMAKEADSKRNEELFGDPDASVRTRAKEFQQLRDNLDAMNDEIATTQDAMNEAWDTGDMETYDKLSAAEESLINKRNAYETNVEFALGQLAEDIAEATGLERDEVLKQLREAENIMETEAYKAYEAAVPEEVEVEVKPAQQPEITATTPDGGLLNINDTVNGVMGQLESDMAGVVNQLTGGTGLSGAANAFGADVSGVVGTEVENGLQNAGNPLEDVFPSWFNGLIDTEGLYGGAETITNGMGSVFGEAVAGLPTDEGYQSAMTLFGQYVPEGLAAGIGTDDEAFLQTALGTWYTSGFNGLLGDSVFNSNLNALGLYTDTGIANGIINNTSVISGAMRHVAGAVTGGFVNNMEIASPSKVMMRLAEYIPAGIAQGIEDNANAPIESMTILGSAVLSALQIAMAQVAAMADDNFEINPMISPVVDLTNVGNAASYMNGALNGSYGVSATMSNAVSSRLNDMERLAASINAAPSQTINGDNITVNVYPTPSQNPEEIADAVIDRINTRGIRRGVAFG